MWKTHIDQQQHQYSYNWSSSWEGPNNYSLLISTVHKSGFISARANSTEESQRRLYEMGSHLRLIKPDAMGEKLQGCIFSIAGVGPAKLDTDVVRLLDGSIA